VWRRGVGRATASSSGLCPSRIHRRPTIPTRPLPLASSLDSGTELHEPPWPQSSTPISLVLCAMSPCCCPHNTRLTQGKDNRHPTPDPASSRHSSARSPSRRRAVASCTPFLFAGRGVCATDRVQGDDESYAARGCERLHGERGRGVERDGGAGRGRPGYSRRLNSTSKRVVCRRDFSPATAQAMHLTQLFGLRLKGRNENGIAFTRSNSGHIALVWAL
jgi:hypothetical protein